MEQDQSAFASPEERLCAFERTVGEHSTHLDVDVRSIVVGVMDAYSAKQIMKADAQQKFELDTVLLARTVAKKIFNPFIEIANDFLAVLVPAVVYLILIYFIVHAITEWDTPLSPSMVFLLVSIPISLAVALGIVSLPKREFRPFPIGVLKDTIGKFSMRLSFGAAISGLLLTSLTTWALLHNFNTQREAKSVSFNSAKTILVDKSLSTMKDLQLSPDTRVTLTKQTEISLGPHNVISIKTEASQQSKTVKYIIDDKGAFPGRLEADVRPGSGMVSWTEEGKTEIVQTKLYVCKVKELIGNRIVVEAISTRDEASPAGSQSSAIRFDLVTDSGQNPAPALTLLVNGVRIDLTFNPDLVSMNELSLGQNLLLAFDAKTHVASRIEPLANRKTQQNTSFIAIRN